MWKRAETDLDDRVYQEEFSQQEGSVCMQDILASFLDRNWKNVVHLCIQPIIITYSAYLQSF